MAGRYRVGAGVTAKHPFDSQPGDTYGCTAKCCWLAELWACIP